MTTCLVSYNDLRTFTLLQQAECDEEIKHQIEEFEDQIRITEPQYIKGEYHPLGLLDRKYRLNKHLYKLIRRLGKTFDGVRCFLTEDNPNHREYYPALENRYIFDSKTLSDYTERYTGFSTYKTLQGILEQIDSKQELVDEAHRIRKMSDDEFVKEFC